MSKNSGNYSFYYLFIFFISVYSINYCSNTNIESNTIKASTVYNINNKNTSKTIKERSNIYNKKDKKHSKNINHNNNINKHKKYYKISNKGKLHIKKYESCVLTIYNIKNHKGKTERYNTIGYGHQLRPGDKYYSRKSITQSEADKLFESDINIINESINRLMSELDSRFNPSQDFIDGFGSLVYNCGESGIRNSILFKRLKNCRYNNNIINKKDLEYAVSAVRNINITHKGHIDRRETECLLMQSII